MTDSLSAQHGVRGTFLTTANTLRHIVIDILMTKIDSTTTDAEVLRRVHGYCVEIFDELSLFKYRAVRRLVPRETFSTLSILTTLMSSTGNDKLLPEIKEGYRNKLSEEEFDMLSNLVDSVNEHLSKTLSREFLDKLPGKKNTTVQKLLS